MSFSLTPTDVIRKHQTNNSTSKEIHMFAKTKRFISPNPEYFRSHSDVPMPSTPSIVSSPIAKLPLAMAKNQISLKISPLALLSPSTISALLWR